MENTDERLEIVTTLRLGRELNERLKALARQEKRELSPMIRILIEEALDARAK